MKSPSPLLLYVYFFRPRVLQMQNLQANSHILCNSCDKELGLLRRNVNVAHFLYCVECVSAKKFHPEHAFLQNWDEDIFLEHLADFTLEGNDGGIVRAHKAVLAGKSKVFKTMLGAGMSEALSGKATISDMAAEELRPFIKFLYTGRVDQRSMECHGVALYRASHKYDLPLLTTICERFLQFNVCRDVRGIFDVAVDYGVQKLQEAVLPFIFSECFVERDPPDVVLKTVRGASKFECFREYRERNSKAVSFLMELALNRMADCLDDPDKVVEKRKETVSGSYQHHKKLKTAQGIKITAQGLEHDIPGTQLYVVGPGDDLNDVKEEAMQEINNVMSLIDKSGRGVYVQASTLGSLGTLLWFLKTPAVSIPVSAIGIGPVHKHDVMRASVMLEKKRKEYAAILAFDVKITPPAWELADEVGIKIFAADTIYHLFDQFKASMPILEGAAEDAVFPCVLSILPNCIFHRKDPLIFGVEILEGIARIGTPLCVPTKDSMDIGKIASIEINHKPVYMAKRGEKVAIKIVGSNADETKKMIGRHFKMEDKLVSHLTRRSIDILKENYRDDLSYYDWRLVGKLKKLLNIS